jgi:hypothetical protein
VVAGSTIVSCWLNAQQAVSTMPGGVLHHPIALARFHVAPESTKAGGLVEATHDMDVDTVGLREDGWRPDRRGSVRLTDDASDRGDVRRRLKARSRRWRVRAPGESQHNQERAR